MKPKQHQELATLVERIAMSQPTPSTTIQEQARKFSEWFNEAVVTYQYKKKTWITSATAIADLIGVATSTVLAWKNAVAVPRRDQCAKIATALEIPVAEVLAAAGQTPTNESGPVTYQELLSYTESSTELPSATKQRLVSALRKATLPEFGASSLKKSADVQLRETTPFLVRAENIASMVETWERQQETR